MKKTITIVLALCMGLSVFAQGGGDSWVVSVNDMDAARRDKITGRVEDIQEKGGATRSVLAAMLISSGQAAITGLVEVTATEVVRMLNIRNAQKKEWLAMIERECNYTDSISSIKGLKDFYSETSRLGALDPSNMNFDGISVRGMRDGHEVLYLSCHIDDSRLDHLFQHSKFCLVVDTLAFHPYECHLPNLGANGIMLAPGEKPVRDNAFSYNEREHLRIGMEISISSFWVNEAITVQDNVELGRFKMEVEIPSGTEVYTYSRAAIDRNRRLLAEGLAPEGEKLDTSYVAMNGDCFVVPRSYMPVSGSESMWGTGEYSMKVKFRESCRFAPDATRNEKMKHWKKDYRQLRKMQKKGSGFTQYWRTVWKQNGNTMVKSMVKSGLTTGVQSTGVMNAPAPKKMGR